MDSRTKPSEAQVIVLQKRGGKAPLKVSDHNCLLLNKFLVGRNGCCMVSGTEREKYYFNLYLLWILDM